VLAAVVADAGIAVLPRFLAGTALVVGLLVVLHHTQIQPLNTLCLLGQPYFEIFCLLILST
jgi:hypothetical protein